MLYSKQLIACCAAMVMWTGCSNDTQLEETQVGEQVQIRVAPLTRLAMTDFVEGDAIGIFAVERSNPQVAAIPSVAPGRANNAKWVKNAEGEWEPATVADRITWSQSGTPMDFYAYFPYDAKITNPAAIGLNLSEQTTASDVLRAANTQGLHKGEVTLAFNHVLARLDVRVTSMVAGDVLRVKGVRTAASFNIGTGEVEATGEPATLLLSYEGQSADDKAWFQAFLPAQTFSGQVQCEHNGASYLFNFSDLTLEKGQVKWVDLKLK